MHLQDTTPELFPAPDNSSNVSLPALLDLLQVLGDEGKLDPLPPVVQVYAAELVHGLADYLEVGT